MFIDHSAHGIRNARSGPHHVKWADVAAPRPRQFEGAPLDPLYRDPNFPKVADAPNPGVELLPGQSDFPPDPTQSTDPLAVPSPEPSSSSIPKDPSTPSLASTQAKAQYTPLGLDVDPGRAPIIAILSGIGFVIILLFFLLLVLPLMQSKKRRYNHLAYASEEERKSMAVNGYPPSPQFFGARPPILSLHLDQSQFDMPSLKKIPPGLHLGAAVVGLPGGRTIPLAPPSPRSGGLPSNPRAGLPVRTPTLRSTTASPTSTDTLDPTMAPPAPFRGGLLRPRSGVVTWSVVDPFDDYNRSWGGMGVDGGRPSHLRPPRPGVAQAVRNSIVSTLSFSGLRGSFYKPRNNRDSTANGGAMGASALRWESMIPEEGVSPEPYAGDIRKAWS